jgi:hypothetical protein
MLSLSTPSISTNTDTVPLELVTVQGGPGAAQPDGVAPCVSQRFASPPETGVVIPGVNWLAEKDADPVRLAVISVILTISGEQETRVFQEVEVLACTRGIGTDEKTAENARRMTRLSKIRALGNLFLSQGFA